MPPSLPDLCPSHTSGNTEIKASVSEVHRFVERRLKEQLQGTIIVGGRSEESPVAMEAHRTSSRHICSNPISQLPHGLHSPLPGRFLCLPFRLVPPGLPPLVCNQIVLLLSVLLFLKIVLMWTIFKSLLNLLQYCFCIMFWFFGRKACGILAP